ncbi:MAG TPA: peptidylprolyl isomerase [Candidatus Glassbacteria bacterium]|nr:peptidylprolyl isomerase [Candidatus Glassbacteria bacterium]
MTYRRINLLNTLGLLALAGVLSSGYGADEMKPLAPPSPGVRQPAEPGITPLTEEDQVAVITTNFGQIILRFYPAIAPNHVKNFISLAQSKFYDGTNFHRVLPGFMIQGGDPNSKDDDLNNDGIGRGPRTVMAEFSKIPHKRGVLSAARSQDPNSASCQFFIMVAEALHLNGQYSAFGKVVEGLGVVDKIVALKRNERDNPGKAALVKTIEIKRAGDVLKFPVNEEVQ